MTPLIGKVVIVKIDSLEYAIDITKVISIERFPDICKIPCVADYISGVMIFRDHIIPVISLRSWFGLCEINLDEQQVKKQRRVVVIEEDGKKIGVAVDAATNVVDIKDASIEEINHQMLKGQPSLVINLQNRLLTILDVTKITKAA